MNFSYFAGHDSFYLREGWLCKGITAIQEVEDIFTNAKLIQAVDLLGVGANMVKSIRFWLDFCGLIGKSSSCKEPYTLTPLALSIIANDPYMQRQETLWLLHREMCLRSVIWNVIFTHNDLILFTKEQAKQLMSLYIKEAEVQYSDTTITSSIDVFIATYLWERQLKTKDPEDNLISPLSHLRLLTKQNGNYCFRTIQETELSPFLIYYILFNDEVIEHSIEDAFGELKKFARTNINGFRTLLSILEHKKFISIERTAGLNMIYDRKKLLPEERLNIIFQESK